MAYCTDRRRRWYRNYRDGIACLQDCGLLHPDPCDRFFCLSLGRKAAQAGQRERAGFQRHAYRCIGVFRLSRNARIAFHTGIIRGRSIFWPEDYR